MSPELGYIGHEESRLFGTVPILDGMPLVGIPMPLDKIPSRGANLLEHSSGRVTVQLDFRASDDPDTLDRYEWRFSLQSATEPIWWLFERVRKRGVPVYFIPWDQELEPFTAGLSLTTFTLPRPTADSIGVEHDDFAYYPTRAWLNTVEQTVIDSGTPATGEVKVAGTAVTTPTLTPGDYLEIRYAPAYEVVIAEMPQSLAATNDLTKQVTLAEAGQAV